MTAIILCVLLGGYSVLDRIVAVVGYQPVLHSDILEALIDSGYDAEEIASGNYAENRFYLEALDTVIEEKLLIEGAIRTGLYPGTDQVNTLVEERIDDMRANFPGEEEYLQALSESGLTTEMLKFELGTLLGEQLAIEQFIRFTTGSAIQSIPTNPANYLEYSVDAVEAVMMPRQLYWIYLPILPSAESRREAEIFLLEIRNSILSGETFEEYAMTLSDDVSASSGGDLDWFSQGDMTITFENAVLSLAPGEISMPIATPLGVHLIRLDEEREDGSMRASHILQSIPITQSDVDRTILLADSIIAQLEEGLSFDDAAANYSADHNTSTIGGDMGVILVGGWNYEFSSAISDLESGMLSEPLVADGGSAVVIFKTGSARYDGQSVDWSTYDDAYLMEIARSVAFQDEYSAVIDSLLQIIPVMYYWEPDED